MTELQDHSPQPSASTVSGGGPGTYNQKEERAREGELHTEPRQWLLSKIYVCPLKDRLLDSA